uniref:Uncharacterized protein n=1 Tax=Sphaerodactylus townsendi TaxID=933632 RepID=A0ACB8FN71_9SAUR
MKAVLLSIKCALPLLFFHLLPTTICQKEFPHEIQGWNYRDGADRVNIEGLKSITRMLEKWGNGIFWQMKYSLLSHPNTLLPELSRYLHINVRCISLLSYR